MRRPVVALVTLCVAGFLGSCGAERPPTSSPEAERSPIAVQMEALQLAQISHRISLVGTVTARSEAVISAKLLSYIRSIAVQEGDRVSAGQTVVVLDDRELRARLDAAQASQAEAESAILAAGHGIASARTQLQLAEITHQRFEDLLAKESVSRQEFDEVDARLKSARAAVELARSAKSQAEAKRGQAGAGIAQAKVMLSYAVLATPVVGVITERMAEPGDLASPGTPLLRIEETAAYRLEVAAPESRLGHLRAGQQLPVAIDVLGAAGPSEGRIIEIVPAVDRRSRTFMVKIQLPPSPSIRSGLYGRAFLAGSPRDILTVPASSVQERGQLRTVFIVQDGRARRRLLTVGERREGRYEVLSGLEAGDRVVLEPGRVQDGNPVESAAGSNDRAGESGS